VAFAVALVLVGVTRANPIRALDYGAWANQKVLMISAHPDDIEACAGGLISLLSAQNTEVGYIIVTNGDKGCSNPALCGNSSSEQIAVAREAEAIAAAAAIGVQAANVFLLDYEDAMVTSYPEQQIRENLVQIMRSFQPKVVVSWYPYPRFELLPSAYGDLGYHPDHQATGKLTLDAQFDSGVGRLFPLAGSGWPVSQFFMWEFVEPTHYIDLSVSAGGNTALQNKITAFQQHKTQYASAAAVAADLTQLAETMANLTGVSGLTYAEGFRAYF